MQPDEFSSEINDGVFLPLKQNRIYYSPEKKNDGLLFSSEIIDGLFFSLKHRTVIFPQKLLTNHNELQKDIKIFDIPVVFNVDDTACALWGEHICILPAANGSGLPTTNQYGFCPS